MNKTMLSYDYEIKEQVYQGKHSVIYRAIRIPDDHPVIIKTIPNNSSIGAERLTGEFQLGSRFDHENIIKYIESTQYKNRPAVILNDDNSKSLKEAIPADGFELEEFFKIALKIINGLETVHMAGLIHKDINPRNILYNPGNNLVKLIDFSISSAIKLEVNYMQDPGDIEGTLSYISPEQTGRLNRPVDYRTDMYSLGVTFYELLNGRLPFLSDDPLDIIHSHIAQKPAPLHIIKPEIPIAVSEIISKLMDKNPETRYKSCSGIKYDLNKCLKKLNTTGEIGFFKLGKKDIPIKLQIPDKLYGREKEIKMLYKAYHQANNGSSLLLLINGKAGVGKTTLANELQVYATGRGCHFISGKFDKFDKNIAYSAFANALRQLIKNILCEKENKILDWKNRILESMGTNSRIIIEIVQELKLITGPQPDVPELDPIESKIRFEHLFQRFINIFTGPGCPLIIFLDDLQWADTASIDLFKSLSSSHDIQNLLLIGAYRDNEVNKTHHLTDAIEEIQKAGVNLNTINLTALSTDDVNDLISESLFTSKKNSRELAELIYNKTAGNIFFVREFLLNLYRKKMITLNKNKKWTWNINEIITIDVTGNVVDLVLGNIKELPENTVGALKLASCFGTRFRQNTLNIMAGSIDKNIEKDLIDAINVNIILKTGDDYKFTHDRILDSVYDLLNDKDKNDFHYRIGRTLLNESIKNGDVKSSIFEIVNHLNLGNNKITVEIEKIDIAELNLFAGEKAMDAAAFQQALYFFSSGLKILPGNIYDEHYSLVFHLKMNYAICEYVQGNYKIAEKKYYEALHFASNRLDRAKILKHLIIYYSQMFDIKMAVGSLIEGLNLFNIGLPSNEKKIKSTLNKEYRTLKKHLGEKKIDDLINLPKMENRNYIAVQDMIVACSESIYFYNINLSYLVYLKSVNISLKHGNSKYSPVSYLGYGMFLIGEFNDSKNGYKLGELALAINKKINENQFNIRLSQLFAAVICHYGKHLNYCANLLFNGYKKSSEIGESYSALFNLSNYLVTIQNKGEKLDILYDKCEKYIPVIREYNNKYIQTSISLIFQFTKALIGETKSLSQLTCQNFQEEIALKKIEDQETKTLLFHYYRNKELLCFLDEDNPGAVEYTMLAEKFYLSTGSLINGIGHSFYHALILLKYYNSTDSQGKKKYLNIIKKNLNKIKIWSDNCPENFLHMFLLIKAELAQLNKKYDEAKILYDRAIESANKNGFIQNEAICFELAAKFYLKINMEKLASIYMIQAHICFSNWGARAKVKQLEKNYPKLLFEKTTGNNSETKHITDKIPKMDLASIIRASQSLSGEINLENLLIKLMHILIKNAGAEKVCLILEKNGEFAVEAEMDINSGGTSILQSTPVDKSKSISQSIVNYVSRSGDDVILDNASVSGNFVNDSYIKKNKPKSIICTSIMNKGKLMGILYQENNITTAAFTPEKVEILKILSYQAAISIENARLYDRQEKTLAELKNLNKLKDRLMKQYQESNFKNLQKRTNPHFLFNAIHTIHGLMITDMGKAENAIIMLGDIYHFIADKSFKSLILFNEEWEFVKNYIEFEEINSPGTISFEIEKSGNFSGVNIPPLTIQPLVENSIKHGLRRRDEIEFLKINAMSKNGNIIIEVLDNGIGMDNEDIFSGTLGNIRDRLKYHYNESDLHVSNTEDGGVRAIISFEQSSGNTL